MADSFTFPLALPNTNTLPTTQAWLGLHDYYDPSHLFVEPRPATPLQNKLQDIYHLADPLTATNNMTDAFNLKTPAPFSRASFWSSIPTAHPATISFENTHAVSPNPDSKIHNLALQKFEHDLKFVMDCFAEVLTATGSADIAQILPWRTGPQSDIFNISNISQMPQATDSRSIRALNIALQMLNLVEENTAMQIRRLREDTNGARPNRGLWEQTFRTLENKNFSPEKIAETLARVYVEFVFTAHPTEARRDDIVRQHREIYLALINILEPNRFSELESAATRRKIKSMLLRLWQTDPVFEYKEAPERDVAAERKYVFHYIEHVLPETVRRHDTRLREIWEAHGYDPKLIADPNSYPRIALGNWVTGDRDGHKYVTENFNLTGETLRDLRAMALKRHDANLERLASVLSLSGEFTTPPQELTKMIARLKKYLGVSGDAICAKNTREPWRQAVNLIRARLSKPDETSSTDYLNPQDFAADLKILRQSLLDAGDDFIVQAEVFPIERDLITFGFHMASLDIRQNSEFHDGAIEELRVEAGIATATPYAEMTFAEKRAWLDHELARKTPRPLHNRAVGLPDKAKQARAVLGSYDVVNTHITAHGTAGVGSFIVSMTRDVTDLLGVYLLGRESGLVHQSKHGMICEIPVVPLLETVNDLQNGESILREFIRHPITQNSLKARAARGERPVIQIMVGYSDSNKFDGPISSLWNLHKAQKKLAQMAQDEGVEIEFFHGRGGTVSRGAGPMNHFLQALPHGSLTGPIRFTIQGEAISDQLGNLGTATYNVEAAVAGVTATTLMHSGDEPDENHIDEIMEYLEKQGREKYTALIKNENFVSFYSEATPYDALNRFRMGSREAKRTGAKSLDDLRAIPWVFGWNQSRFYFPGWYGVGSALAKMKAERSDLFEQLKSKIHRSPFLRYIFTNFEASTASADLEIMNEYAELVENNTARENIMSEISEEFVKTNSLMADLFGSSMEERRPRMVHTLDLRDQALRQLHHQQVELLKSWRAANKTQDTKTADQLLPQILITIAAIASGERTTG